MHDQVTSIYGVTYQDLTYISLSQRFSVTRMRRERASRLTSYFMQIRLSSSERVKTQRSYSYF